MSNKLEGFIHTLVTPDVGGANASIVLMLEDAGIVDLTLPYEEWMQPGIRVSYGPTGIEPLRPDEWCSSEAFPDDATDVVLVGNSRGEVTVNTGEWAHLTPAQAEAMAAALREHAKYVRATAKNQERQ